MADRSMYKLNINKDGTAVTVHKGLERVAVVRHGKTRNITGKIPQYIQQECINILNATTFELNRGYLLNGGQCQINDRRK